MTKYAVLGSGQVGKVLADGLLGLGHEVMRASREPSKLAEWKAGAGAGAQVGTFAEAAAWGNQVVLAVKGSAIANGTVGAALDFAVLDYRAGIAAFLKK